MLISSWMRFKPWQGASSFSDHIIVIISQYFTSDHILKYLKVLEGRIFSEADASSGSLRKQLAMSPTLVLIT